MIFWDGVGIGKEDYTSNPFFKYGFKTFQNLFGSIPTLDNQIIEKDNRFIFPVDATLGIEGLPQSGTGQTSIFCGINASKFVGKHFGPYPYSTLIPIIKEKNIFKYYLNKNEKVQFANAYPKVFFDYLKSGKSPKGVLRTRLSVTSLSCRLSGMKLNRATNVRKGDALTAEITAERWNKKLGYNLPIIQPKTAAKRLLKIADKNKFTLYEYFLTDHIGHGRYDGDYEKTFKILDDFLYNIFIQMDNKKLTLIICSDHGNIEDLSTKSHTMNPALTITAGKYAKKLYKNIKDLTDIKRSIISICK